MAIIDSQSVFSWLQSIFASGADVASTNIIDLAPHLAANAAYPADAFVGNDILVEAVITTAVTGGTSIQPVLQTDSTAAFASPTEFPFCGPIPVAQAIAGKKITTRVNNGGAKRYLRVVWRNVGANTAGVGSAYVVEDAQNAPIQAGSGFFVG